MRTFQAAAGQELNPAKTKLLPIGASPPNTLLPSTIHGLKVVSSATALGITFHNGVQPPSADWPGLLAQVEECFTKLSRLRLSAFGRGFSSAAYGISTLLFHAEYAGFPPAAFQPGRAGRPAGTFAQLATWTAKLVDRGLAPADTKHKFSGVRGDLLAAPPANGGFGAMPWREHISARHACWGARLISAGIPQHQPAPPGQHPS